MAAPRGPCWAHTARRVRTQFKVSGTHLRVLNDARHPPIRENEQARTARGQHAVRCRGRAAVLDAENGHAPAHQQVLRDTGGRNDQLTRRGPRGVGRTGGMEHECSRTAGAVTSKDGGENLEEPLHSSETFRLRSANLRRGHGNSCTGAFGEGIEQLCTVRCNANSNTPAKNNRS